MLLQERLPGDFYVSGATLAGTNDGSRERQRRGDYWPMQPGVGGVGNGAMKEDLRQDLSPGLGSWSAPSTTGALGQLGGNRGEPREAREARAHWLTT